jgi:tetratricopeptide (TPR) repeat protein
VARRGARALQSGDGPEGSSRQEWANPGTSLRGPSDQEEWRDDGPVDRPGQEYRRPLRRASAERFELPPEVAAELQAAVGRSRAAKAANLLSAAARAYAADRYAEALRMTKFLVTSVPDSVSARELHGLVCYRLGRFREAVRHLDKARELSGGDPSQLPVVMDCHRALGHHRRVAGLWEELRIASPEADVLAEGRLVLAADLADRGEVEQAIDLLVAAGAGRSLRHPAERHVRQWYLLADLSERSGNLPRARELFSRVVDADPELADAAARLAALGRAPRRGTDRRSIDRRGSARRAGGNRGPGPADRGGAGGGR